MRFVRLKKLINHATIELISNRPTVIWAHITKLQCSESKGLDI